MTSSHSWTRADARRVLANLCAALKADPAQRLITHLVERTYPGCTAAAAAMHEMEAPQWLLSWCQRYSVEPRRVALLEVTLFDGAGGACQILQLAASYDAM